MTSRKRDWVFTYNNPTITKEALRDIFIEMNTIYVVIGSELAPSTGTPHYQGYVYFANAKTLNQLTKKFPNVHFSMAKGTAEQNLTYCSKEDPEPIIYGDIPKQGKRTDLNEIRETITNGEGMVEVIKKGANLQGIKYAETLLRYIEPFRDFKPKVEWWWGPTGCGKTSGALKEFAERPWISGKNLQYWEGYDAHKCVLIDDFRKDFCTFHELLRILDRYEYRVRVLYGTRQLLANHIIITAPYYPQELYDGREDIEQLIRRIDIIKEVCADTDTNTEVGVIVCPTSKECIERDMVC